MRLCVGSWNCDICQLKLKVKPFIVSSVGILEDFLAAYRWWAIGNRCNELITHKSLDSRNNFFLSKCRFCIFFKLRNTTQTLTNTCTQTLPISIFEDELPNPRDWRSYHRRLPVDGNVAYHWKHNTVKSQNIRSRDESNLGPQILPRLL